MNITRAHNIITITDKVEIHKVMFKGQKIYNKFGLIFLYKNDKKALHKAGILVKKKSGCAVKRNYIKRIIRSFIRNEIRLVYKYNKIIFLYNYQGQVSYKELKMSYINSIKNYEKNIPDIN
jgi:ribonuclease P protein component